MRNKKPTRKEPKKSRKARNRRNKEPADKVISRAKRLEVIVIDTSAIIDLENIIPEDKAEGIYKIIASKIVLVPGIVYEEIKDHYRVWQNNHRQEIGPEARELVEEIDEKTRRFFKGEAMEKTSYQGLTFKVDPKLAEEARYKVWMMAHSSDINSKPISREDKEVISLATICACGGLQGENEEIKPFKNIGVLTSDQGIINCRKAINEYVRDIYRVAETYHKHQRPNIIFIDTKTGKRKNVRK